MQTKLEWLKITILLLIVAAVAGSAIQNRKDHSYLVKLIEQSGVAVADGGKGQAAPPAKPTVVDPSPYIGKEDPAWGPEDAKVTLVEYSDYQCPYCRRFHNEAYKAIKETYGNRIRFVFKHFPLRSIHPHAEGAAVAAQCAMKQGKFWKYNDILFDNQSNLAADALVRYAAEVGLDVAAFQKCIADPKVKAKVLADLDSGLKLGITGTPGFLLNGVKISGAQPFENFRQAIEQSLGKK